MQLEKLSCEWECSAFVVDIPVDSARQRIVGKECAGKIALKKRTPIKWTSQSSPITSTSQIVFSDIEHNKHATLHKDKFVDCKLNKFHTSLGQLEEPRSGYMWQGLLQHYIPTFSRSSDANATTSTALLRRHFLDATNYSHWSLWRSPRPPPHRSRSRASAL